MIDLASQRSAELVFHDSALRREWQAWCKRADGPTKPFAKHQSQIARITDLLEAFLDTIDTTNVKTAFGPQETAYRYLLGIYRIWSYFRSKLSMRTDNLLGDTLRCADQLAWACYEPLREQAKRASGIDVERLKEPPLVFFSSDTTPFAQARTTPFLPEGLAERDIIDFSELILSLPVPVIGVPWFHLNHLPAIPVLAHEVGHAVEVDFQLAKPLKECFVALDIHPQRRKAWLQWRKEIFADVYACICMGPAYLLALINYLIGDAQEVQKEERRPSDWGGHPTRTLRIKLNLKILEQLGLLQHGGPPEPLGHFLAAVDQVWCLAYPEHRMQPFEADIETVVCTSLNAQFNTIGGVALIDIKELQYAGTDLVRSWYLSDDVLGNDSFPPEAKTWSFRVLAAAPALAYARCPQQYYEIDAQAAVLESLLAAIPSGVRAADPDADDSLTARKQAADREMGRKLMAFFR